MTTSKAASSVDAIAGHSSSTGGGFLFKRSTLVPLLLGLFLCSSAADAVKATTTTTTTTTPAPFCGDGRCSVGIGETCTSCPADCGVCTNPNCPVGTSTCKCLDGSTSCSFDQDCPAIVTTTTVLVCDSGTNAGLSCQTNADCPKPRNTFGTCTTKTVTTSTRALTGTCIDKSAANCCNLWCSQSSILGGLVKHGIDGSGFMNTPHCDCGGSYCATCAATPWVQSHYTGMSGTVCDDPHNIYKPCESDNGGTVVAKFKGNSTWNECTLGTFTASGVIDAGGICRCMGTVTDGDGDGAGTEPFTKELWNSGCADCNGDLSFCLPYAKFCFWTL